MAPAVAAKRRPRRTSAPTTSARTPDTARGTRQRSPDAVVRTVKQGILTGHYLPGARLTEADLCSTFGLSRGPVREAMTRLAAEGGDGKAAYQLGLSSLAGDARKAPDAREAVRWWSLASAAGHPLATRRLAELYRDGAEGLPADAEQAARLVARAQALGL